MHLFNYISWALVVLSDLDPGDVCQQHKAINVRCIVTKSNTNLSAVLIFANLETQAPT